MTSGERPLKVLFLNEDLGGLRTMALGIASALPGIPGITGEVVDVPKAGLVRRALAVQVPGLKKLDLDLQPLRFQLGQSWVTRGILRERLDEFDAVHACSHNVALLAADLLRDTPFVVSLDATNRLNAFSLPYRDPTRFTGTMIRPTAALERRVYGSAEAVCPWSSWCAASVRGDYGVPDEKIHVIPFGIEVHDVPEVEKSDPPRITFVAYTMARKGGWRLLEVFKRHLAGRARLTLVTKDRVEPSPGVEVIGDIVPGDPRLRSILASSTAFAFPTEMDPFGYAPIEAMAMGVPVVASRLNALPEIVDDGVTGLLVPTGDDDALRRALEQLLDDPQRAHEMGQAARQRVLERFDARVTTSQLASVLLAAAGRAPAP